jgi:uncharacterized 2Fe-2S/4Fe-4S cluster protein (DUF4445 family)
MRQVTVYPGGMIVHVEEGTPVRELLVREGLLVDFPCGGRGLCNQCRIRIDPPPSSGKGGKKPLGQEELASGMRLACQAVIEADCALYIPAEKEVEVAWRDPAKAEGPQILYGEPLVVRRELTLPAPALADQRADWERLRDSLAESGSTAPVMPPITPATLEGVGRILRAAKWRVDAFLQENELLCIHPVSSEPVYGFAVDLGTTTIDVALHNLETGRQIGRKVLLNRQSAFGADVISRAQAFHEDPDRVRAAALQTICDCAESLLEETGVSRERVVRTTVVGNSIMIHIFHGLDARQLTLAPYIPLVSGMVRRPPEDFGFDFQPCGWVESLPLISAFVGADTVGVILSLDLEHEKEPSLSIDIGTNGEMVLSRAGELITTSTAAGPAFEGAQISCGMRALDGAITGIGISGTGEVSSQVVGGRRPKGICGSGLISGVAALLEAGVLDRSGRLLDVEEVKNPGLRRRLFRKDNLLAFRLSDGAGPEVYISQKDIRELQLAKGATRTGIDMLLSEVGIEAGALAKIRLAGNFGSGLDIARTIRIGLIPDVPVERVDVVGNAALRGASLALVSREYRRRACEVYRRSRFLELAAKPDFQMRFATSMFF